MNQPHFFYRAGGFFQRININDIVYIKADNNYLEFYTRSAKHIVRMTMDTAMKLLPEDKFMRTHRSYAIAMAYLDKVGKDDVTVLTDPATEVPIIQKHYVECVQKLTIIESSQPFSRIDSSSRKLNTLSAFGIRTAWGEVCDDPDLSDIAKLIKKMDAGGAEYECFYIDNYEVCDILQITWNKDVYYTFGEHVDNNLFTILDSWEEAEELCSQFLNNKFEKVKSFIKHKNEELPEE